MIYHTHTYLYIEVLWWHFISNVLASFLRLHFAFLIRFFW